MELWRGPHKSWVLQVFWEESCSSPCSATLFPPSARPLPATYSVTMAWNTSLDTGVTGYSIYYGAARGNYTNSIDTGNGTTGTVSGLVAGVTYFFAVASYDMNGAVSTFSNEINYTPGIPKIRIRVTPARQVVLTVRGQIAHTYEIQATQNLLTWTVIGTVTLGTNAMLEFTDPNAANYPNRSYLVHAIPCPDGPCHRRESTKDQIMTFYLCQRCWGRSCLHLTAALRAGHWRWHLAGIRREIHFTRSLVRRVTTNCWSETR